MIKKQNPSTSLRASEGDSITSRAVRALKKNYELYLIFLPVLVYYIVFYYKPMLGLVIAFKDYAPGKGIWGSNWVGFTHFRNFFSSPNFARTLINTIRISVSSLIFSFPAPIIFALSLNELRLNKTKKVIQTVSYMPHFISLVVAVGLVLDFVQRAGVINDIIALCGGERIAFMTEPNWFTPIYIMSDIWQEVGWSSIIYLAAIAGVSADLYEAAAIDGAGRFRQLIHVTLPGIMPTIVILFIMKTGNIMSLGYEKIILMYNDMVLEKADIISSYVYRISFGAAPNYGYSTAVGLFNTVINVILLVSTNYICGKVNETTLW